ncbi:MAG TPA: hypothetical protein VMH84_07155 [Xanthobacteraceae bacterium]|nr:hypothetical protein [Xanthobacteraceae bacterium]
MNPRNKRIGIAIAIVLAIAVGSYAFKASSQERGHGFGMMFMHGMGHGMMGAGINSATKSEMDIIHELIINHDLIRRTVTNLPDGIRTVTESDDPRIALFIKEHVAGMGERVNTQRDPGLPIESQALHMIFRNKDKIKTAAETIEKGVIVTQTSNDQETVVALQQHASEVSDLVRDGMLAVQTAMMRNGMMHDQGMHRHGGPMGNRPDRSGMPGAR